MYQNKEIEEIPLLMCCKNSYTGDEKMNRMIEVLRRSAPPETYIAQCTTMRDITYMRRNPAWHRIRNEFGHIDVSRKPNGIYMFPTFYGHYKSGHWYLTVLVKSVSLWFGWTVDSLRDSKDNRMAFAKKTIQKIIQQKIRWKQCKCIKQEEVECGPRTICHMVAIVQNIMTSPMEEMLSTFNSNTYMATGSTSVRTAARQTCERMLQVPYHTPTLPINLCKTTTHTQGNDRPQSNRTKSNVVKMVPKKTLSLKE